MRYVTIHAGIGTETGLEPDADQLKAQLEAIVSDPYFIDALTVLDEDVYFSSVLTGNETVAETPLDARLSVIDNPLDIGGVLLPLGDLLGYLAANPIEDSGSSISFANVIGDMPAIAVLAVGEQAYALEVCWLLQSYSERKDPNAETWCLDAPHAGCTGTLAVCLKELAEIVELSEVALDAVEVNCRMFGYASVSGCTVFWRAPLGDTSFPIEEADEEDSIDDTHAD